MLRSRISQLVLVLVLGLLVMGGTAFVLKPKIVKVDLEKVQYLYCRSCAKEFHFEKLKMDLTDPCPLCGAKRAPLAESIKKTQYKNPYLRMMTFLFVELVALLAVVWLVLRPRDGDQEVEYLYTNCPHCRQKIRYTEKQIGKPCQCRRCKKSFEFPEVEARV